jgi:hypothetical protein
MIVVAALAIFWEALGGLSESHRWYRQKSWAIQFRTWAAEVEARKGTPDERPGDVWLLQECRRSAMKHEQWARQFRPRFVGLTCVVAVVLAPVAWITYRVARRPRRLGTPGAPMPV